MSPAVEIEPFYSILPVVGPALLLKEVLAMPGQHGTVGLRAAGADYEPRV